jgi:hypothetical protein
MQLYPTGLAIPDQFRKVLLKTGQIYFYFDLERQKTIFVVFRAQLDLGGTNGQTPSDSAAQRATMNHHKVSP